MAPRRAPSSALTGPLPSATATMRSAPTWTLTVASVVTPNTESVADVGTPPRSVSPSLLSPWSVMTRKDSTVK